MVERLIDTFDFEDDDQLRLEIGNTDINLVGMDFAIVRAELLGDTADDSAHLNNLHLLSLPEVAVDLLQVLEVVDSDSGGAHLSVNSSLPVLGEAQPSIQQDDMSLIDLDPGAC